MNDKKYARDLSSSRSEAKNFYEIRISGCLDPRWLSWFEGMQVINLPEEEATLLRGPIVDQAALHGILNKIRDLNLNLLMVQKI